MYLVLTKVTVIKMITMIENRKSRQIHQYKNPWNSLQKYLLVESTLPELESKYNDSV